MKLLRFGLFVVLSIVPLSVSSFDAGARSQQTGAALATQSVRSPLTAELCSDLALRCVGPTLTSGRISAITIDPRDSKVWYVAAGAGGLWKTTDGGTSFKCLTDNIGSFSMGSVALDPKNPDTVWLGSGEQQSQRSVDFGDGVYKSTDGGKTWKNMGLRTSEHIARIHVDPRNSSVVYVAAMGPLWSPGGERGVYKTSDGGKTWIPSLVISESTGVVDLVMDPRDPGLLYAAAFQRRRNTGVAVGGGPECGIYKTTDGGAKWIKMTEGLPTGMMGRVALAISPQNPDIVYAQIAGADSGFYRTENKGVSWKRVNTKGGGADMYYGDIFADPHKAGRVFVTGTNILMTEDGGNNFGNAPVGKGVHVDHHAMAFDLEDSNHVLLGNDGGLYESKDGMKNWRHFPAVAVSQFYRIWTDNATPFYYVFGGTQDNGSQGGPSRTANKIGIRTADWKKVGGGDGFQGRSDPYDPKILYTMSQGGALQRNKKSIKPGGGKGGGGGGKGGGMGGVRWNWDSPFIISPHSPSRLYFASSVLHRSDDRGDNWKTISPDLTRQLDYTKIPVMGKLWPPNTPAFHKSTTDLSVCNALDESPLKDGLIYVGTNDGLLQVTENAGTSWRKIDAFPGVPQFATVSDVCPSNHDVDTVYVSLHNYEAGDFRPYLLKSTDRGRTWTSIANNLPARDFVWSIAEDPVNENLLFVGTEFGLYLSLDGGKHWVQLKGGVPTISFRDLEIHKREGDLIGGTFGRGILIFDDITPLRQATPQTLAKEAALFTPRKTFVYEEKTSVKPSGNNSEMPNPPFGALLNYHLRDDLAGGAKIVLTVTDAAGKKLRDISGPATAGFHRVTWDLRPDGGRSSDLVKPGKYKVILNKDVNKVITPLGHAQEFELVPLGEQGMAAEHPLFDDPDPQQKGGGR